MGKKKPIDLINLSIEHEDAIDHE